MSARTDYKGRLGAVLVVLLVGACSTTDLDPTPAPNVEASTAPDVIVQPSGEGLTRDEAIAVARQAVPEAAAWGVRVAKAGPLEDIFTARGEFDWSRELPPDRWIWQVTFGVGRALDSRGAHVFIDYTDGRVYEVLMTRG
jgi:hypothetical protein